MYSILVLCCPSYDLITLYTYTCIKSEEEKNIFELDSSLCLHINIMNVFFRMYVMIL